MKRTSVFSLIFMIIFTQCKFKNMQKNSAQRKSDRIEKVIERYQDGKVKKTYDGYIYREYDLLGRKTESYGNQKTPDNDRNARVKISYSDTLIVAKIYVFDDYNIECKIINVDDCYIHKYFYRKGKLIRSEKHNPIKDKNENVIRHDLVEVDDKPDINPYLWRVPDYLK